MSQLLLCDNLPSTMEEDEKILRNHSDPNTMTDEQAKEIIEAGHRLYLRRHWSNKFNEEFDQGYTDDIIIYPDIDGDLWKGREYIKNIAENVYGNGKLYVSKLKLIEVFRAGNYLIEWSKYEESNSSVGYFVVMWRFEDGRWRRMRDIYNRILTNNGSSK